jgi:hypothetical protein
MFSLTGVESVLSHNLASPVDVTNGEWELGLIELTTYNSIPNIETDKNDKFYYGKNNVIAVPEGSYEIEDIEKFLISKLPKNVTLTLKPNNNTLKSELCCTEDVDFSKPHSLGSLLGFNNKVYKANTTHVSELPVDIIKVNSIRVECNVTRGSYQNGVEGHIIHEFYPAYPPGYKIIEIPRNVIYLPVISQRINNLTVALKDQDGNLVNFRGERISVRLHLRRRDGSSI